VTVPLSSLSPSHAILKDDDCRESKIELGSAESLLATEVITTSKSVSSNAILTVPGRAQTLVQAKAGLS
jgi:hypothetical protein